MTTTRPRTSGLNLQRRQSVRAFYEPLSDLNVEEKEEDGAHILRFQLLGFGERPMGNSRWIRLDKTYSIPEDCIIDKINRQFDQGILTISMPKPTPPHAAAETAADPPLKKDEVRPIETKEPEKDLPKDDSNKSAVLEKQVSDRVKEELERKLTTKREDSSEVKDQKLIQKEEVNNQIAEQEEEESKTEKEDIKNEISEKEKEESKTEKEEIKKQISEKEKEESKTEKKSKEKEKAETTPKPASRVTRTAKLAGKFVIGRLPWPVKANLAATVVIVAAYFAYTYYQLPKN